MISNCDLQYEHRELKSDIPGTALVWSLRILGPGTVDVSLQVFMV